MSSSINHENDFTSLNASRMRKIISRKAILDERYKNDTNPKNLYKLLLQLKQKAKIT